MVENGQPAIRPVVFESRLSDEISVEVIERTDLLSRVSPARLATPQRPSFELLMLVRAGSGVHTVDFHRLPVMADRLVWVRSGQVQLWDAESDFDASIVLSRAPPFAAQAWFPGGDSHRDLGVASMTTAKALVEALRREQVRFSDDGSSSRLMNALFTSLCAVFDRAQPRSIETTLPGAYVAFRDAIEQDPGRSHHVRDYVSDIDYSERTVSRACRSVTGMSAKAVLSERLVLEARRLLAHTDKPASAIGAELGFSEASNFHKFFSRCAGQHPSQFRQSVRQPR